VPRAAPAIVCFTVPEVLGEDESRLAPARILLTHKRKYGTRDQHEDRTRSSLVSLFLLFLSLSPSLDSTTVTVLRQT